MTLPIDTRPKHPAPFRDDHIQVAREMLDGRGVQTILDPFAGTGKVHDLRRYGFETYGVEKEPEWAEQGAPWTVVGNVLELREVIAAQAFYPRFPITFDACVTSPSFGNRMADNFDAKDGSRRHTYRHYLGRPIEGESSAVLQWGKKYRAFHVNAWAEVTEVVERFFILNIKDHIRAGRRQPVTQWHIDCLHSLGWEMVEHRRIEAPGQRHGENHALRVPDESMILFERGRPS